MIQQFETIQEITDPEKRAELYKKVFGSCCDTPQTQIISQSFNLSYEVLNKTS
jgi:hypothetical protein